MLRIESRHDGTPLAVEVRSLTAVLDEGERVLNISWHQPTNWLAEALQGASVVVDVSNSPSFEDGPVMEFFTTSTTNQLAVEADAGVRHHVALSIVGTERLTESGYIRGEDRPGEADHGERDPVLDRPCDAVLRVHDAHRG